MRGSCGDPFGIETSADYFSRDLRDDGIAVGAQLSHSGGNPMSQQTNAGFNAPGFSVGADCEAGTMPSGCTSDRFDMPWPLAFFSAMYSGVCAGKWSRALGVGYSAACLGSWSSRERVDPSGFMPVVAIPALSFQSRADAVAHKACALIATSPAEFPASLFPSFAFARLVGVGHKPKWISSMGRIDGTSRDNGRPAGVANAF